MYTSSTIKNSKRTTAEVNKTGAIAKVKLLVGKVIL